MLAALVKKELLALSRDGYGLAALFLMPVLFIILMSLALQDVYRPALKTLPWALQQHDRGAPARALLARWQREHGAPLALPADWPAQLRSGQLKYVLVLQNGLSDELQRPSLPTEPSLRLLAEPGIDSNLLNTLQAQLISTAGELKARIALAQDGALPPPPEASMLALVQAERYGSSGPRPSAVQQNVPAWLVFGMFFVIASMSSLMVQERSSGTLARLRSLGVGRGVLLASKALPYLAVNAVQALLMLAVGVWLMPLLGGEALSLAGVHGGALGLALLATSAAAVGLALALACAVRSHAQAFAIGPLVNVLMAAVGGIMVPKFVMPAFMQRAAEYSPMNWGLEALLGVLLRGADASALLPQLLRLGGFAALMSGLAWLLLRPPTR
jgi:ABC-2 type transport system permease protein